MTEKQLAKSHSAEKKNDLFSPTNQQCKKKKRGRGEMIET